jgi:hypothetical protein
MKRLIYVRGTIELKESGVEFSIEKHLNKKARLILEDRKVYILGIEFYCEKC